MLQHDLPGVQPAGAACKPARNAGIGEIACHLLLEDYAPACVVINPKHEIVYSFGQVGQFLSPHGGQPPQELPASIPPDLRHKLRLAVQAVFRSKMPDTIAGGNIMRGGAVLHYRIDVLPLPDDAPLAMLCFVTEPAPVPPNLPDHQPDATTALLELELEALRAELQGVIRELEISNHEHRAINEKAIAANEEYQVNIAELMTWKTGLASLATEMTALNAQLQAALEAQRGTSNILGNILDNLGAAILLLDLDLNIRFFTPAIQPFFRLIASDIGRPLEDLHYMAPDEHLAGDCRAVLQTPQSLDRKIALASDRWFLRRILPYRTEGGEVDGLVISFGDITETRAMLLAEAAASAEQGRHLTGGTKLRHLLQTISILQESLEGNSPAEGEQELIRLIGKTASALSSTLDNLLGGQNEAAGPEPRYAADVRQAGGIRDDAARKVASLTKRERQIMRMVVAGQPSKIIATDLGISQRTVENHRAAIMRKTGSKSLPALARIAFASGLSAIAERHGTRV